MFIPNVNSNLNTYAMSINSFEQKIDKNCRCKCFGFVLFELRLLYFVPMAIAMLIDLFQSGSI